MPIVSHPVTGFCKEESGLSSLPHPSSIRYLYTLTRHPPSLLFSKKNYQSALSLSSYGTCSSPFLTSAALRWTCASMSMSHFYWGAQNRTQHSRRVSPVPSSREGLLPLTLQAMPYIMQSSRLLAFFARRAYCWLLVNFLSTGAWSYLSPVASLFVELHKIPVGSFLQLVEVTLRGSSTTLCINHSSQSCIICKPVKVALRPVIIRVINKDFKQYCPQHRSLECTTSYWPPPGLCVTHHNPSSPEVQSVFKSTSLGLCSPHFISMSMRLLWRL